MFGGKSYEAGRIMRSARKILGLNQVEACARYGCSQGWLSKMENGNGTMDTKIMFEMCVDAVNAMREHNDRAKIN